LNAAGHPVVIGVPGFILHTDMKEARLLVRMPNSLSLSGIQQDPPNVLLLEDLPSPKVQPRGSYLASFRMRSSVDLKDDNAAAWSSCLMGSYTHNAAQESSCPSYIGRVRLRLSFKSRAAPRGDIPLVQVRQKALLDTARSKADLSASIHPTLPHLILIVSFLKLFETTDISLLWSPGRAAACGSSCQGACRQLWHQFL
jgi:hypothetical protein